MSTISTNVMRRVRVIHAVRPLVSGGAFASFLVLLAVWGIGREVWVAHVIANMPAIQDPAALARFFVAAFTNTTFVVQVLVILAGGGFVYALREFTRVLTLQARYA